MSAALSQFIGTLLPYAHRFLYHRHISTGLEPPVVVGLDSLECYEATDLHVVVELLSEKRGESKYQTAPIALSAVLSEGRLCWDSQV